MDENQEIDATLLPDGIRSRFVAGVNGLRMHLLEAGYDPPGRPRLLLLHGFPELAYSWRRVMAPLAAAGFHVIAPDQRGYGRTTGWSADYDGDLAPFRMMNLVRDQVALLAALGHDDVEMVIGHDFGSPVAAWCALIRPDVFRAVALMSAPFEGPPGFTADDTRPDAATVDARLAALDRPRRHYQRYYGTRAADGDMRHCAQGIGDFLRAYFHVKSADWDGNEPRPLAGWTGEAMSVMPTYYIMDQDVDMAATVAPYMPDAAEVAACAWLPPAALDFYAGEYARTGFQGGLQWYRCTYDPAQAAELRLFAGRRIEVPACFIAGARDWGVHQRPGGFEAMQTAACADLRFIELIAGAGHWVQQEQPAAVTRTLERFHACI